MNVPSEVSKAVEEITNIAAYNHAIVQMGDGDNAFSTEMFQADIQPIVAAMLERISNLEGLLRECRSHVNATVISLQYEAEKTESEQFASECRAEANLHRGFLSRIDAALKTKEVDGA